MVPRYLRGRPASSFSPWDDADHPVRLGHRQANILEPIEALPADRGEKVLLRHELLLQRLRSNVPVMDQDPRLTLDQALHAASPVHRVGQQEIRAQEDQSTEEATDQRVVVSDHGVLQHVREREEHDDVERGQLAELSPPEDPDRHEQEQVHGDRADRSLLPRRADRDQVVPHAGPPPGNRVVACR